LPNKQNSTRGQKKKTKGKEGKTQQRGNPKQQPCKHTSSQGKPNKTVPGKTQKLNATTNATFTRPPIAEENLENRVQQKRTGARM